MFAITTTVIFIFSHSCAYSLRPRPRQINQLKLQVNAGQMKSSSTSGFNNLTLPQAINNTLLEKGLVSGLVESLSFELSNGVVKEFAGDAPELIGWTFRAFLESFLYKALHTVCLKQGDKSGSNFNDSRYAILVGMPVFVSMARFVLVHAIVHALVHTISGSSVHLVVEELPVLSTVIAEESSLLSKAAVEELSLIKSAVAEESSVLSKAAAKELSLMKSAVDEESLVLSSLTARGELTALKSLVADESSMLSKAAAEELSVLKTAGAEESSVLSNALVEELPMLSTVAEEAIILTTL